MSTTDAASWYETGNSWFPWAFEDERGWHVLRLNDFPDHPLYTYFLAGRRIRDYDDPPEEWTFRKGAALAEERVAVALGPISTFLAYGSEVGRPCDNPFCCGLLTGRDDERR